MRLTENVVWERTVDAGLNIVHIPLVHRAITIEIGSRRRGESRWNARGTVESLHAELFRLKH